MVKRQMEEAPPIPTHLLQSEVGPEDVADGLRDVGVDLVGRVGGLVARGDGLVGRVGGLVSRGVALCEEARIGKLGVGRGNRLPRAIDAEGRGWVLGCGEVCAGSR